MYSPAINLAIVSALRQGHKTVYVKAGEQIVVARIVIHPHLYLVADTQWASDVPLMNRDIDSILDEEVVERTTTPGHDPRGYGYRSGP